MTMALGNQCTTGKISVRDFINFFPHIQHCLAPVINVSSQLGGMDLQIQPFLALQAGKKPGFGKTRGVTMTCHK